MTSEEYYAAVAKLNLRPTAVPHIYICVGTGITYHVPNAQEYTDEQRAMLIGRLG